MVAATRKDPKLNERKDLLALFVQQEAQDFQAVKGSAKRGSAAKATPNSAVLRECLVPGLLWGARSDVVGTLLTGGPCPALAALSVTLSQNS